MKLYATITADKLINGKQVEVSKGQGGNEYLKIIIRDEKKHCIAYLKIRQEKRITIDADILETVDVNINNCVQILTDDDDKKSQRPKLNQYGKNMVKNFELLEKIKSQKAINGVIECKNCGYQNNTHNEHCDDCGKNLI